MGSLLHPDGPGNRQLRWQAGKTGDGLERRRRGHLDILAVNGVCSIGDRDGWGRLDARTDGQRSLTGTAPGGIIKNPRIALEECPGSSRLSQQQIVPEDPGKIDDSHKQKQNRRKNERKFYRGRPGSRFRSDECCPTNHCLILRLRCRSRSAISTGENGAADTRERTLGLKSCVLRGISANCGTMQRVIAEISSVPLTIWAARSGDNRRRAKSCCCCVFSSSLEILDLWLQ